MCAFYSIKNNRKWKTASDFLSTNARHLKDVYALQTEQKSKLRKYYRYWEDILIFQRHINAQKCVNICSQVKRKKEEETQRTGPEYWINNSLFRYWRSLEICKHLVIYYVHTIFYNPNIYLCLHLSITFESGP